MLSWIKQNYNIIIASLTALVIMVFCYSCEPKVLSLNGGDKLVTRAELSFELETFMSLAELRMVELDRKEQIRNLILQNALVLIEGQPLNPLGLVTGFAALYGMSRAGSGVAKKIKNGVKKRKADNGTG